MDNGIYRNPYTGNDSHHPGAYMKFKDANEEREGYQCRANEWTRDENNWFSLIPCKNERQVIRVDDDGVQWVGYFCEACRSKAKNRPFPGGVTKWITNGALFDKYTFVGGPVDGLEIEVHHWNPERLSNTYEIETPNGKAIYRKQGGLMIFDKESSECKETIERKPKEVIYVYG